MKRLLIAFACLLFIALIVITAAPWGLPDADGIAAVNSDGELTLGVENRIASNYIYNIRDDGITHIYSIPALSGGNAAPLLSACMDGESLFVLRDIPQKSVWQVLSLSGGNTFLPVAEFSCNKGDTFLDFSLLKGTSHITLRDASGNTKVYECNDLETGKFALLLLYEAPAAGTVEQAKYLSGTLYLLMSGGEELSVSSGGVSSLSDSELFKDTELHALHVPFSYRLVSKAPLYLLCLCVLAIVFIPLLIAETIRHRTTSLYVRASALIITLFAITSLLMCGFCVLYTAYKVSLEAVPDLILRLFVPLLLCVIAVSFLFTVLLKRSLKSFTVLSAQMSRIADGDYSVSEIPDRGDEIGIMARLLQEMCISLSIRDYEIRNTMLSYHRFVPRGLEQLLDRASVMEVSLGDSRATSGNTAIITVCNRQSIRLLLSDDDYVSFLNRSSSLMDSAIRSHNGLLLSSGYDMSGNKVFFQGDSNNGVRAGLDLLGSAAEYCAGKSANPQFFVLLHNTVFLYGIAGSTDNLFPYISSSELEFLGSFSDQFRSAGVQIVITEPFLKQLDGNYTTRYIGFVSSTDFQLSFKLYEVMDAYSDIERNLRVSYDQRLQEAIIMFYKSDYYLARNLFSNILRVCPTDGIARWYLFACEHFFHAPEGEVPNFQLFGMSFD